jgi:hypothetical protein
MSEQGQDPVDVLLVEDDPGDALYIVKPTGFDGFGDMIKQIDACFAGLIQPPPTG